MSKATWFFRFGVLGAILILSGPWSCEPGPTAVSDLPRVAMEPGFTPAVSICTWKSDKRAALTLAFDDTKESHYLLAAPELEQRGFVGTFNLNTRDVYSWRPWQHLFEKGHELGSHTWSHPNCSLISESRFLQEVSLAKLDLERHISGLKPVASFAYPFGANRAENTRIVSRYHLCARCGHGINSPDTCGDGLFELKGIGAYPPFDQAQLEGQLERTLKRGGWMIYYFHSVVDSLPPDRYHMPLAFFQQHLDAIASRRDSFWIDTQRNIAEYLSLRHNAQIEIESLSRDEINVRIRTRPGSSMWLYHTELTVRIKLPESWRGHSLIIQHANGTFSSRTLTQGSETMLLRIHNSDELNLFATPQRAHRSPLRVSG